MERSGISTETVRQLPGMLEIADAGPDELALGARAHSLILGKAMAPALERLELDDWTCRVCGTRIPDCMEVDHLDVHAARGSKGLSAICQFCHNLRHPLWAAARGRFRLFWGPDMAQRDVHRAAWQVFFASGRVGGSDADPELRSAAALVVEDIDRRESALECIAGSADACGFLEALLTARDLLSDSAFRRIAAALDGIVRFWPSATDRAANREIAAPASLSCWREGRFEDLAADAASRHWETEQSSERLRGLFQSEAGQD